MPDVQLITIRGVPARNPNVIVFGLGVDFLEVWRIPDLLGLVCSKRSGEARGTGGESRTQQMAEPSAVSGTHRIKIAEENQIMLQSYIKLSQHNYTIETGTMSCNVRIEKLISHGQSELRYMYSEQRSLYGWNWGNTIGSGDERKQRVHVQSRSCRSIRNIVLVPYRRDRNNYPPP